MKRILNIMLSLLIFFSTSLCVSSQSDQKDLDQVKLVKQFLGTWKSEIGKDSIILMEVVPSGEGLYFHLEWKAQGESYRTVRSILGFTDQNESVVMYDLWNDGSLSEDIGKFVSAKKLVVERYAPENNHAVALLEWEFQTPDICFVTMKWRGMNVTWEPVNTPEWTFTKVKE